MARRERLERLAPWFEPSRSPFGAGATPRDVQQRLLAAIGVPAPLATKVPRPPGGGVALEARLPEMLGLEGFERMAGPIVFALPPGSSNQRFDVADERGDLRVVVTTSGVAVSVADAAPLTFALSRILKETAAGPPNRPRMLRQSRDELTVGLLFDRLNGRSDEGGAAGFSGRVWVLIGAGAPKGGP